MQHANDDMDALMRKAGVDYPLYTGSADWSKVAAALETKEETPLPKNNYGKYLGLILVFLLPWLITQFDSGKIKGTGSIAKTNLINREEPLTTAPQTSSENLTRQVQTPVENPEGDISINFNFTGNSGIRTTRASGFAEANPGSQQENNLVERNAGKDRVEKSEQSSFQSATSTNANQIVADVKMNQSNSTGTLAGETAVVNYNTDKLNSADAPAEQTAKKQEAEKESSSAKPTTTIQPRKKFYVGIVGGINVTTIKMQEVKEMGTDFGFIAGYKFSKSWSIEAGILSSSKYYYSDGEYLDNPKIYLPPNTEITAVMGDCRMIEIPLVLKYDFGFKKAHNWFATAGISSFLMKQEDYAYDYYYTSSGTTHTYNKTYENESKDWAAVLQISGGYRHSIPFGMNLRLEPFIQIPLKGAGYGNLPLTSAGLRLGITRTLF